MPYNLSARDITSIYPEGIDTRKRRVGKDMHSASATIDNRIYYLWCNLTTQKKEKK